MSDTNLTDSYGQTRDQNIDFHDLLHVLNRFAPRHSEERVRPCKKVGL